MKKEILEHISAVAIENRKLKEINAMLEALCDSLTEKNCELVQENKILNDTQLINITLMGGDKYGAAKVNKT